MQEQECTLDVNTIEAAVAGRNGRWRRCWRIMRIILRNWRQ